MTNPQQHDFFGPGVVYGWSARRDGPMNEVGWFDLDEERKANRVAFIANELKVKQFVIPRLLHGAVCEAVEMPATTQGIVRCDALVTDRKGLALVVGMADCFPVFFYDPRKGVIGIAHCGWRGVIAGVINSVVSKMVKEYGCVRDDISALIGPGICAKHYEIGADVAAKFGLPVMGTWHLDLAAEIESRLLGAGIYTTKIAECIDCTFHTLDQNGEHKYFSYRRDKSDPLDTQIAAIVMR